MPCRAKTAPMRTMITPTTTSATLIAFQYRAWLPDSPVHHRLLLGVLQEGFHPMLLAKAGLLGTAKGQLVVGDDQGVHPRVARLELLHRSVGGRHVRGPDRRAEAEGRVVAEPDALIQVLDLPHRQGGTEDLLGPHARPIGHVLEDRRLDEPALVVVRALRPSTPVDHLGAALDRVLDLCLDLSPLRLAV